MDDYNTCSENVKHSYDKLGRKPSPTVRYWKGVTGKLHPGFGSKHMVGRCGKLSCRSIPVRCNTLDIEFESACLAAKALDVSQASISAICRGKHIATKGLTFSFL